KLKAAEDAADYKASELRTPAEIGKRIKHLEEKMYQYARDLEFESAGQLRDEIQQLRDQLVRLG
ncbi:MAG: UvrB/UvrC motif-containing protein, partial [Pseudomonas neustonica]